MYHVPIGGNGVETRRGKSTTCWPGSDTTTLWACPGSSPPPPAMQSSWICKYSFPELLTVKQTQLTVFVVRRTLNDQKQFFLNKKKCYWPVLFCSICGHPLFVWLCDSPSYSESTVCGYMVQLLSALAHLHSANIAHMDIRPENLLLEADNRTLKLIGENNSQNNVDIFTPVF